MAAPPRPQPWERVRHDVADRMRASCLWWPPPSSGLTGATSQVRVEIHQHHRGTPTLSTTRPNACQRLLATEWPRLATVFQEPAGDIRACGDQDRSGTGKKRSRLMAGPAITIG